MQIKNRTNENCRWLGFFLEPMQELHVPVKTINSTKEARNLSKPLKTNYNKTFYVYAQLSLS